MSDILSEEESRQQNRLIEQMMQMEDDGNEAEWNELFKKLLLPASVLKDCKEVQGAKWIKEQGINTSRADKEYGSDWLEK